MLNHLAILPILVPVVTAALLLLPYFASQPTARRVLSAVSFGLTLVCALVLAMQVQSGSQLYLLGDWPAPFGIVLVADKLSATFVVLATVLMIGGWLYSCGRDDTQEPFFVALLHFLLMGVNGAFLTGDLFNLFVFFEVLLISSSGVLIHGGGKNRIRAALHYVLLNLIGSALFLLALALLYSQLGSLQITDMGQRIATLSPSQQWIVQSAAGLLLIVFGLKAAMLPFHFWLPTAYKQASPVVACVFAVMTKVGVYSLLRVFTTLFSSDADHLAGFGQTGLVISGLLTIAIAGVILLASADLRGLVAALVLMSAGTLLSLVGIGTVATDSALLYYAVHSTIATGAMFLLVDIISIQRGNLGDRIARGRRMQYQLATGWAFAFLALAIIGMPPLSGFIGKIQLLQSVVGSPWQFEFWAMLLFASLLVLIVLSRAGSSIFWRLLPGKAADNPVSNWQWAGLLWLLVSLLILVLAAEPLLHYFSAATTEFSLPLRHAKGA
jgi:multicomponent K+:H+ antiporter subunit D